MLMEHYGWIGKGLNLIKSGNPLSFCHKDSLVKFADQFISVSLNDPATVSIVKEVNIHNHTKKACQKYDTNCRFHFPRFPTFKTIISSPANIVYPVEKERKNMMKRYTTFLEAVKEVLEDKSSMEDIVAYKQELIEAIFSERNLKWRIKQIVQELEYDKKPTCVIPNDLREELEEFFDESGNARIEALKEKEQNLSNHEEEMTNLVKDRIEKMLEFVDPGKIDKSVSSPLEEYIDALSVNKKGYSIHYKRDVMETMVNTYNPEWISAWNGNMDFQLCLDYFAVITYISDYYCKDDSGTMQMLHEALRESSNENLKTQLQKVVSVFLTHRQMGESEAYFRILPSMHMKESNIKTVFAQTGFFPSRFLEKVEETETIHCEKVVGSTRKDRKISREAFII